LRGEANKKIASTMADVARVAGVSAMTVSRALREGLPVAAETRARIMKAVDALGYVLDQSAGAFSTGRTGFIAVLVPALDNPNFADTVRGLTDALAGSGLQLLLGETGYSLEQEERTIASLLRRRPEGVVLTGGQHTQRARQLLEQSSAPVVETWDLPKSPIGHVVGFSNAEAVGRLVDYLHRKAYRRIAFLGGTGERDNRGADRRAGYEAALERLGLPRGRVISFATPPTSLRQGGEAIGRLLDLWPEVEAAICVSDLSAFGALMECRRRQLPVPQRIAIAGFGNFELSAACSPSITTVSVHGYDIGQRAGALLLRAVEKQRQGKHLLRQTVVTPYEVVARESA
jgi:LacI family transcriptional regulator, gluconate utilization system Gnt-I transcriptional repressor